MSEAKLSELLYEEAKRGLSNDLTIINDIRGRAAALFAAAIVATSFLGAATTTSVSTTGTGPTATRTVSTETKSRKLGGYGKVAFALFAGAAMITVVMLMPRTIHFAWDTIVSTR